jgi:hypothetical protein
MVVASVLLSVNLACSPTQPLGLGFTHLFSAAVVQTVEDAAAVVRVLAAAAAAPPLRNRLASRVHVDLNVTTSPRHRSRASSVSPVLPSVEIRPPGLRHGRKLPLDRRYRGRYLMTMEMPRYTSRNLRVVSNNTRYYDGGYTVEYRDLIVAGPQGRRGRRETRTDC